MNGGETRARGPQVVVIGGGLAGLAAALACADAGARVTLVERRNRLGGLTWSFRHSGRWIDNGQHVFLRCCDQYLAFLDRIGAASDVELPERLDIPVVAPSPAPGGSPCWGRLRRSDLPAPFHLAGSLLRYPHLSRRDRIGLGRAVWSLRGIDLRDPALDDESFGSWLARHGQSPAAVTALWDLITVPTVNLRAAEASLAMAAKVFQTGLLTETGAADIGWSRVPLGQLHGERAAVALEKAGVALHFGVQVQKIEPAGLAGRAGGFAVRTAGGTLGTDAVITAVPHEVATTILPTGSVSHQDRLGELGASAIVDVHLVFDRPVTRWPLLAGLDSPVQWVFDRTESSGLRSEGDRDQYVAVSVSAADEMLGRRPDELVPWIVHELARLLPEVAGARVLDSLVTKERNATFRARPGTAPLRPGPRTAWPGLAVAGAWTDTGWPATMEGAVRSGQAAAEACLRAHVNFESPHTEEVA
jgi:squalene-associated FAD-dependent desaturase